MNFNGIVADALTFAAVAHGDQKRKFTGEPYIVHPIAVAALLSRAGFLRPEVIAAGILHDVVEDCGITPSAIQDQFGKLVRQWVEEVTDVSQPRDGNRAARKAIDRDHLAKAGFEGRSIKLADLIDNTRSIVARDPDFAKVYMAEKALLLPVLRGGDPFLWDMASELLERYQRAVGLRPDK